MERKKRIQTYNVDLYAMKNAFKLLVFVIDKCNYRCEYCYNTFPRTSSVLDLDKLYFFINDILIAKLHKDHIWLELIGGEPTLHPDLQNFCKKISKLPTVYTTIYTNFSKDPQYYIDLIDNDSRLSLILSWHKSNHEFLQKLIQIPKNIIKDNITVSVIYEHNNISEALRIFDSVYKSYPYIKELAFPLIDNNENYVNEYSVNDIVEYNKRLKNVKDITHIRIDYNDNSYEIVDQHHFIVDRKTRDFSRWLCNAGIDFCFIYFNGDICPCDGYKNVRLGNLYSDKLKDFQLHKKQIFCKNTCCPCVLDVRKKQVFVKSCSLI